MRSRNYDPATSRMLSEDTYWTPYNSIYGDDPLSLNGYTYVPDIQAIMQSGNLYVYCMNNPLRFVDSQGFKAGDIFKSQDEAAKDWAYEYYGTSDYVNMEVSSWFYMVWDGNKLLGYAYTEAIVGSPHSSTGFWDGEKKIPKDGVASGWIHTHPNADTTFSTSDKNIAKDNYLTAYVVAPGTIGGTNIDIKKYGDTRRGFKVQDVASDISYRSLTDAEKTSLRNNKTYKARWDAHDPATCGRTGCQGKSWPTK